VRVMPPSPVLHLNPPSGAQSRSPDWFQPKRITLPLGDTVTLGRRHGNCMSESRNGYFDRPQEETSVSRKHAMVKAENNKVHAASSNAPESADVNTYVDIHQGY